MAKRHNPQSNPGRTSYVLRGGKMVAVRTTAKNRNVLGAGWPRWSRNLGCLPKQWPALRAKMAKHGVKCEYDPKTGCVKVESKQHQRLLCEAQGMIDYNAGLSGDAQPKDVHYEAQRERESEDRFWNNLEHEIRERERALSESDRRAYQDVIRKFL